MLDLDRVERMLDDFPTVFDTDRWASETMLTLVAELRAAREESQELKKAAAAMAELATRREVALRAHRQALEVASPIIEGLRPMHGRTAKAHESPCAACRFVAAVDKLTEETTEPARGGA